MDFAILVLALVWWQLMTYFWYAILLPFWIGCFLAWRKKNYKYAIWGLVISWVLSFILAIIGLCLTHW